jgi:hypothetical protein
VRPDGRSKPNGDPDGKVSEEAGYSSRQAVVAQTAALTKFAESD